MAIPPYYEFYNLFLEALKDGNIHPYSDCLQYIKQKMNFTEADLAETVPSGPPKWSNRVAWCKVDLKNAGLIMSPQRAHFQITDLGNTLLREGTQITYKLLLERCPAFSNKQQAGSADISTQQKTESADNIKTVDETPQEIFDRVYQEMNSELADEILNTVHSMSPVFFERLVVRLIESMGYGGYDGAGHLTPVSNDGGIDGIVDEDKLGFNRIYIQAKRWALDTVIGRPEIQKFVGALADQPKIGKGLYITTAKFSDGAREYAKKQHIILVDGKKLAELMIEFDVGVSTQKTYKIKRIDSDFFNEDE